MRKRALKYIQIKQEKWFQFLPTPKTRVYTLLSPMPSVYQQENLEAMLGLFLEAQGYPLPEHSKTKSASALSRFLNIYNWSTLSVIRTTRNRVIKEILSERLLGRKPFLQVIIDLTTLEKFGKFKGFENLIRLISPRTETGDCRSLGSGEKGGISQRLDAPRIAPKNLLTGFWFCGKMGARLIIVNY